MIGPEITGIHCLLAADIDNDGREDLVVANGYLTNEDSGDL